MKLYLGLKAYLEEMLHGKTERKAPWIQQAMTGCHNSKTIIDGLKRAIHPGKCISKLKGVRKLT